MGYITLRSLSEDLTHLLSSSKIDHHPEQSALIKELSTFDKLDISILEAMIMCRGKSYTPFSSAESHLGLVCFVHHCRSRMQGETLEGKHTPSNVIVPEKCGDFTLLREVWSFIDVT